MQIYGSGDADLMSREEMSMIDTPNNKHSKIDKIRRNRLLDAGLPRFQGTRPDHVRVERLSCC